MERIDLTKVLLEKGFGENKLALLLVPAFGSYGIPLMIITTIALCISTYILFVGSASRLLNNLSEENRVPKIFIKKSKNNSPYISIIFFSIIHIINIVLVGLNYLNIELLVSFANIFFISNALLGIFASMKLFKNTYNFIATFILATMLCILLIFSSKKILLIPIFMFISVFIRNKRKAINSPI
jgi:APA family basic amino acid/polyamine antiporter